MSNTQPLISNNNNNYTGFSPQMQNNQMVNSNMPPQGIPLIEENLYIKQKEQQLLQQNGTQRLQILQECYIQHTQKDGCSDLLICKPFFKEISIKLDPSTETPLFKIKFDQLTCLQQNIKGNLYSMDHTSSPGYVQEQEIYSLKRVRKNCILKGICCPFLPITCCIYCASNSSGTIYNQQGQNISQTKFASLCKNTHTVSIQDGNTFTLQKPQKTQQNLFSQERVYQVLKQGNLTDIYVKFYMRYTGTSSTSSGFTQSVQGKYINFGQGTLSADEKISIIFLASQIMA